MAYWLKATGAPNTHERAVTAVLAELCPGLLPRVLDSNAEWNAWLMAEDATGSDDLVHGYSILRASTQHIRLFGEAMPTEHRFNMPGKFSRCQRARRHTEPRG